MSHTVFSADAFVQAFWGGFHRRLRVVCIKDWARYENGKLEMRSNVNSVTSPRTVKHVVCKKETRTEGKTIVLALSPTDKSVVFFPFPSKIYPFRPRTKLLLFFFNFRIVCSCIFYNRQRPGLPRVALRSCKSRPNVRYVRNTARPCKRSVHVNRWTCRRWGLIIVTRKMSRHKI